MVNHLLLIQFIHPGKEHQPDTHRVKYWNTCAHKRKFAKNSGIYLDSNTIQKNGELVFWCEWEPQSEVFDEINEPEKGYPQFIYTLHWLPPSNYKYLDSQKKKFYQNTDPFIFESSFKYALCQQKGKLKNLAQGSVILFGSQINKHHFCLDTVFVVDDWIEYNNRNYKRNLNGKVTKEYLDITINPMKPLWENAENEESFRLYFGATYDNPICDMFSFFPCQLFKKGTKGFQRPIIEIPAVINGSLKQGTKYTEFADLQSIKLYWEEVVRQVKQQSLFLGISSALPIKTSSRR